MSGPRADSARVGELLVADRLEGRHLQPLHCEGHVRQDDVHAARLELVRERVSRITPLGRAFGSGGGDAEAVFQYLERGPCCERHLLVPPEDGSVEGPPEASPQMSSSLSLRSGVFTRTSFRPIPNLRSFTSRNVSVERPWPVTRLATSVSWSSFSKSVQFNAMTACLRSARTTNPEYLREETPHLLFVDGHLALPGGRPSAQAPAPSHVAARQALADPLPPPS